MTDAYQDAVNKLMTYLDQTADFAKGQLPELANEILVYGYTQHFLYACISALFCLLCLLVVSVGFSLLKENEDGGAGITVFFGLLFLILIYATGSEVLDLYQIKQAPKLYVLHELNKEMKQ